jgi:hypothetical protein
MLIVAESKLRTGDWQGALVIVNQIRAIVGVPARVASDLNTTWTWVKLEKLIEFWMEARAVGERRRWIGDGTDTPAPGDLPANLKIDDRTGKDRCWPITQQEAQTNPYLNGTKGGG